MGHIADCHKDRGTGPNGAKILSGMGSGNNRSVHLLLAAFPGPDVSGQSVGP